MISRRLLRIKIMQLLYAFFNSADNSINKYEKELIFSINKTYDLYHYLLLLIVELAKYAQSRIEIARQKRIPTYEDINPNTRFVDNPVINQIRINESLLHYLNGIKLSWVNYPEMIKKLYDEISGDDYFKEYMNKKECSYEDDKKLVIWIYSDIIQYFELLDQNLEDQSIFWNDEMEFVISNIIKTLKKFKESDGEHSSLLSLYKNEDDKEFVKKLFRKVAINHKEYRSLIEDYTKNWDVDRIAFLDILIMQMAVAEAIEFPSIPTKVTYNEYIEIAKFYSTDKSSQFINGILDKIFQHLKDTNKIVKQGRGLIGEV
jgi:transcription antitermination protein NusB